MVNKPAGLLTIRDGYNPDLPSLRSIIEQEIGSCFIVHRLDKETSGVLILARNKETHRLLNLSFQNRTVQKIYHAIIAGNPPTSAFIVDQPLRINADRKHRTCVDLNDGKPAITEVTVITSFSKASLVSAMPRTGYTHQIRAHLSSSGYPILGDPLYGVPGLPILHDDSIISRTALHAYQITFRHPATNESVSFCAPYPDDFKSALLKLNEEIRN
mgnify:FL=1